MEDTITEAKSVGKEKLGNQAVRKAKGSPSQKTGSPQETKSQEN